MSHKPQVLSVTEGGTGQTSFTSNGVLYGNGSGNVSVTSQGAANTVLLGTGGAPSFGQIANGALQNSTITLTQPSAGISITGSPVSLGGVATFALANDLSALEGLASTGIAVRTAADSWTTRSIDVTASTGISVSNGNGVSGNPTLAGIQATTSAVGVVELATNAEVTTGTSTSLVSPLSSMVYHKGVAKAWVNHNMTGGFADGFNISSVTDVGVGTATINYTTAMANANYAAVTGVRDSSGNIVTVDITAQTTTSTTLQYRGASSLVLGILLVENVPVDPTSGGNLVVMGNL